MPDIAQTRDTSFKESTRASRLLALACLVLLPVIYASLTLFGSFDFLLNAPNIVRLHTGTKAPLVGESAGASAQPISLPDDWRESRETGQASWRYSFVFELPDKPQQDQEIYLPHVSDNARITINGKQQPHHGSLSGEDVSLHWSIPLIFAAPGDDFKVGRNELLVDVYVNESVFGSLKSVSIGPRGAFEAHRWAMMLSKRGLAYVVFAVAVFSILALGLYAAAVPGRFYSVSLVISASMLGAVIPHVVGTPLVSVVFMFCSAISSFLLLQCCWVYLCEQLFFIERKVMKIILCINCLNIIAHMLLPLTVESYAQFIEIILYLSILTQITGGWTTFLLVRRFLSYGETAVGLVLLFAFSITVLGIRDVLVILTWIPSYHGYYTLHGLVVMVMCLVGLIALRIRAGAQEQAWYQESMREALDLAKRNLRQANAVPAETALDALVSRIATTYSHEFRNPLAAALATNKLMMRSRWGSPAQVAQRRIQRSILSVSDTLDQRFDFQRAMQSTNHSFENKKLPVWLLFVREYQSCKIVWLSDPSKLPIDESASVEAWLTPLLEEFEKTPSVCLIHQQGTEVVLHLYLHLNKGDEINGRAMGAELLSHLCPQSVREAADGQYLYWRYAR